MAGGWLDILNSARPRPGYGVTLKAEGGAELSSPVTIAKPVVDRSRMAVTCVLTTPSPDRQGDIVVPGGCDLTEHRLNPIVLFHHGKAGHLPIGKAEDPAGNYTVRLVTGPDGSERLVGTTYFAQNDEESGRFAKSVFQLIDEDILRGVSVGFDPLIDDEDPETHVTKSIERLGPSPRLDRDALRFNKWRLLEYSHTPLGVNREALTVAVHKSLDGSREMHPALLRYLAPLAAPRKTVVAVAAVPAPAVVKAMPDEDYGDDYGQGGDAVESDGATPAESPPESPDEEAGGEDMPTPGVRAMLDAAQGMLDLADQIDAQIQQSEHIKTRKYGKKLCSDLRETAQEAKDFADKTSAELKGHDDKMEGDEKPDDEGGDDETEVDENEGEPEPIEKAADGAIVVKSYPGFTPRRWGPADLDRSTPRPTRPAAPAAAPAVQKSTDANELERLREENAQLEVTLRNMVADMKAAVRRRA